MEPSVKLVLDCVDLEAMTAFWRDALRYRVRGVFGPYASLVCP